MEQQQKQRKSINLDERVCPEFKEKLAKAKHIFKDFPEDDFTEKRKEFHEMIKDFPTYKTDKVIEETKHIPGPENAPEIFVRIFRPKNSESGGKLPGLLWIHGGGQLFGHTDFTKYWCSIYAEQANCIAVALDYRLTPENPYPASLEDCYATLVWMRKATDEVGIDADRIAVGGDSAGGCLTAALCLLSRDRKGPKICFQMPLYPMLDDRNVTPSSYEIIDERVWNRHANIAAWKMYLKNYKDKEIPIYAAPTRAQDLSNLPPTFTFIGELDLFRDETIDYVQRLMQAGVPVEFHIYSGCTHSFEWIFSDSEFTKRVLTTNVLALKNATHPS